MNIRHVLIDFELLSQMLDFPKNNFVELLERCEYDVCTSREEEIRSFFYEFLTYANETDPHHIQYQHVNTFQLSNEHSLLVADYLLSTSIFEIKKYTNGLEAMYKRYNFTRNKCRPDYLPELIRFAPLLEDNDEFESFLNNQILFPLITMISNISNDKPYKDLLSFIGNCIATEIDLIQRSNYELWAEIA